MATAYPDTGENCKERVNRYIVKPVDYDQFTDVVRQLGSYWLLLNEPPLSLK